MMASRSHPTKLNSENRRPRSQKDQLAGHIYRALPELDRAAAIADRIRNSINVGLIREGDRLPSEMEMAESFGVAAATLRDALSRLRDEGTVETRRGRNGGTFVLGHPPASSAAISQFAQTSIVELRDLGDERIAISTATTRLATARADDTDFARLARLRAEFAEAGSPARRSQSYSRVWMEIAVAAQSRRLLNAELRIQVELAQILWLESIGFTSVAGPLMSLRELHNALVERDETTAIATVEDRIKNDTFQLIDSRLTLSLNVDEKGGIRDQE